MTAPNILVCIADAEACALMCAGLRSYHRCVMVADHARDLLVQMRAAQAGLLVMSPPHANADAAAVVRALRAHSLLPLILLTFGDDSTSRIRALESGADDCIGMLVEPRELAARIGNVLRRAGAARSLGGRRFDARLIEATQAVWRRLRDRLTQGRWQRS